MALFTSAMPSYSGDNAQDIAALRSWACRLIGELRSLIYALDEQNVIKAQTVNASGVLGVLSEAQIPDIDISKVKGNRPYCIVEPGADNGLSIVDADGELLAHIYYEESEDKSAALVIASAADTGISANGNVDVVTSKNVNIIGAEGVNIGGSTEVSGNMTISGDVEIGGILTVNGTTIAGGGV